MSEESQRCAAVTKAGAPCKNPAQAGSDYCFIHRHLSETAAPAGKSARTTAEAARLEEVRQMVAELNQLAQEIQNRTPEYTPPPFTPQGLVRLLKENLHRFSPDVQLEIVRELQANLQDASAKDLLDPDTWKGVWFILNYSLQNETASLRESLTSRLAALPGMSTIAGLTGMLKGLSPKDLLDLDTWKGMFFLVNYSVQHEAQALKERILGGNENEDEG